MSFTIAEQSNLRFMAAGGEKKKKEKKTGLVRNGWSRSDESFISICSSRIACAIQLLSSFLTQPIQETRRTNESYFHGWLSRMFREYFPPAAFALPEFRRVENLGN